MPQRPRLTPPMADVRRAVRSGLEEAGLSSGDLVLVACSGGADSLALAAAAVFVGAQASDALGLRVGAVIVEHGLQEVTAKVAEETAARLRELGLDPVEVVAVTVDGQSGAVTGGTEAAARDVRYAALAASARRLGAKAILLGHTLNDQAETVLLGLARGSGLKSVAGMRAVTPESGFVYLRPLLVLNRADTEAFCRDSGLSYWTDPHNSDSKFARVRVRTEALPALEAAIGPGVAEALTRTAELVRDDLDYLEAQAEKAYGDLVKLGPTGITISAAAIGALPNALASRIVHRAIGVFGANPTKAHVDQVLQLVRNWHGQKELALPSVRVFRQGHDLTLKSSKTLRPGAC